jgi:hypothetical protein
MAAAEPITAFLCGRYVFGERLQTGVTGAIGVGGGLFLMVCGVVLCAVGRVTLAAAPALAEPAPAAEPAGLAPSARPSAAPAREPAAAPVRWAAPMIRRHSGATRYQPPTPALPYLPPFERAERRPDHLPPHERDPQDRPDHDGDGAEHRDWSGVGRHAAARATRADDD